MPHTKLLVSEYMQTKIATAHPQDTVADVVKQMIDRKTNGLVVIDDEGCLVGILSSWDIIKHIVPDYLENEEHLAGFEAAEVFRNRIESIQNDPIEKFMTRNVKFGKKETTLIEAAALLTKFHIRQLPIVDDSNHLIGYINRTDIKLAAGEILNELNGEKI